MNERDIVFTTDNGLLVAEDEVDDLKARTPVRPQHLVGLFLGPVILLIVLGFLGKTAVSAAVLPPLTAPITASKGPPDSVYVTIFDTDEIAVINTVSQTLDSTLDIATLGCDGPFDTAVAPGNDLLFVNCPLSGNVLVLDTQTYTVVHSVENITPSGLVDTRGLAFSRDGSLAFIAWDDILYENGQLIAIDTNTFITTTIPFDNKRVWTVAAHPYRDIVYVATADQGEGKIYAVNTNDLNDVTHVKTISGATYILRMVVSADGRFLHMMDFDTNELISINTLSYEIVPLSSQPQSYIGDISVSPNGSEFYMTENGNAVTVFDVVENGSDLYVTRVHTVTLPTDVLNVATSCDGQMLYVADLIGNAYAIDTSTYTTATIPITNQEIVNIAACEPNVSVPPTFVYAPRLGFNDEQDVAVINEQTQRVDAMLSLDNCDYPLGITPDESMIFVGCHISNLLGEVVVLDAQTHTILQYIDLPVPTPFYIEALAFSHDSAYAFALSQVEGDLFVIDTKTFSATEITIPNGDINGIVMHPYLDVLYLTVYFDSYFGGSRLYTMSTDDFSSLEGVQVILDEDVGYLLSLDIAPDGEWLYGKYHGSREGYRFNTYTHEYESKLYLDEWSSVSIGRDSSVLYFTQFTNTVTVVDADTFSITRTIPTPTIVYRTEVTCDGDYLYAVAVDDVVYRIDVVSGTILNTIPNVGASDIVACANYVAEGVVAVPNAQMVPGGLGETVTTTVQVINAEDSPYSYTLTAGNNNWPVALSSNIVDIVIPGTAVTLTLTTTIPAHVSWYATDTTLITATATTSPTHIVTIAAVTGEAYAPPDVQATPDHVHVTLLANETTTHTVTLSNGNGVTATTNLFNGGADFTFAVVGGIEALRDMPFFASRADLNAYAFEYVDWEDDMSAYDGLIAFSIPIFDAQTKLEVINGFYNSGRPIILDTMNIPTAIQPELLDIFGVINPQRRLFTINRINRNHPIGFDSKPVAIPVTDVFTNYHMEANGATWIVEGDGGEGLAFAKEGTARTVIFNKSVFPYIADVSGNAIRWAAQSNETAEWLTHQPVTSTLPTSRTQDVRLILDATMKQPGDYQTTLYAVTNVIEAMDFITRTYQTVPITVSLHVSPTSSMGTVVGTVTDANTSQPISATITVLGQPYIVVADSLTGDYQLWLEAGSYTLQITADSYLTATYPVTITAQQMTTLEAALIPIAPVALVTPSAISAAQFLGEVVTHTLTLGNGGALPLTYDTVVVGASWATVTPQMGTVAMNSVVTLLVTFDATQLAAGTFTAELHIHTNDPLSATRIVPLTLVVDNIGQIAGTVTDAATQMPLNATIAISGGGSVAATPAYTLDLVAGTYNLTAYATGYITATQLVTVTAGMTTVQDIALTPLLPQLVYDTLPISYTLLEGETATHIVVVDNIGNAPLVVDVAALVGVPWLSATPTQTVVAPQTAVSLTLYIDTTDIDPGLYHTTFTFFHNDPALPNPATINVILRVEALPPIVTAVALTPQTISQTATVGESVVYTFTVTNQGNHTDTFALDVAADWNVVLSTESTGVLASEQAETIYLTVTVPMTATTGHVATVTAQSLTDVSVRQSAQAITNIVALPTPSWQLYLPFIQKP